MESKILEVLNFYMVKNTSYGYLSIMVKENGQIFGMCNYVLHCCMGKMGRYQSNTVKEQNLGKFRP